MAKTANTPTKVSKQAVNREKARLMELYAGLPANKLELAAGLIDQAARLRCYLDALWKDIQRSGATEKFSQGNAAPYDRERPCARLFTTADKNYGNVIKQLDAMLPEETTSDALSEMMGD